jgi:hypothetical protein
MVLPVVGRFLAERHCDGHLRHDGGAAAADQAALDQHDLRAGTRGADGRACRPRPRR